MKLSIEQYANLALRFDKKDENLKILLRELCEEELLIFYTVCRGLAFYEKSKTVNGLVTLKMVNEIEKQLQSDFKQILSYDSTGLIQNIDLAEKQAIALSGATIWACDFQESIACLSCAVKYREKSVAAQIITSFIYVSYFRPISREEVEMNLRLDMYRLYFL